MISLITLFIFSIEALAQSNVIAAQRDLEHYHNRWWHRWYFILWFTVALTLWAKTDNWFIPVAMIVCRLWCLQVILNLARGIQVSHLGKYGTDRLMSRLVFGHDWVIVILKSAALACLFLYEFKFL